MRMQTIVLWVGVAVGLVVGSGGGARAQSSPVSELWRQWAVIEEAWRAERVEVEADRRRLRERAEAKKKSGAAGQKQGEAAGQKQGEAAGQKQGEAAGPQKSEAAGAKAGAGVVQSAKQGG